MKKHYEVKMSQYIKDLVRANGIDIAINIAKRSAKQSSPLLEGTLPTGDVFFPNDKKGGATRAIKERAKTHAFWTNVAGILEKGGK